MKNKDLIEAEKAQIIASEINKLGRDCPQLKTYIENNTKQIETLITRLNDNERSTRFRKEYGNYNPNDKIERFKQKLSKETYLKGRRKIIRIASSLSAAIIVFSLFIFNRPTQESEIAVAENTTSEKINVPTLITQDSVIKITGDNSKIIASKYYNEDITHADKKLRSTQQRLIIPSAGIYSVLLSDGTEVMLNANSELSYPSFFNKTGNREVTLKGEAFFNVAKSNQPFIVHTHNGAYVRVYGTQFNMNAKSPERVITILVEGSVGFGSKDQSEIKIKPNQMIIWNSISNSNEVVNINPEDYLSWKEGVFEYTNGNFNAIISEVESWYGVTFNYDRKQFENHKMSMSIGRNIEIKDLLTIIEDITKTENIKFIKELNGEYGIIK